MPKTTGDFADRRSLTGARCLPAAIVALVASVVARRREFSAVCEAGGVCSMSEFSQVCYIFTFFARFSTFLAHFQPFSLQAASPQDAHQSQAFAAALVRAQQVGEQSYPRGGDSTGIACAGLCHNLRGVWHHLISCFFCILGALGFDEK